MGDLITRLCQLGECGKKHYSKGYCRGHYDRMKKYGDPLAGRQSPRSGEKTCATEGCGAPAPRRRLCAKCNSSQWRAENPERAREADRRNRRIFYAANVERVAAENRAYRIAHPEKFQGYQKARAVAITSHPDYCPYTEQEWEALKRRYDFRCAYCGEKTEALEQDHVVPVSRGGRHALANIVPACTPCNRSKHDHLLIEWTVLLTRGR
jgi:5-methylcytosine-specific restriction endonuclease McrA